MSKLQAPYATYNVYENYTVYRALDEVGIPLKPHIFMHRYSYNIISIFRKDSPVVMDVALLHVHSNISAASLSYFQQVFQINTVNRVE